MMMNCLYDDELFPWEDIYKILKEQKLVTQSNL